MEILHIFHSFAAKLDQAGEAELSEELKDNNEANSINLGPLSDNRGSIPPGSEKESTMGLHLDDAM